MLKMCTLASAERGCRGARGCFWLRENTDFIIDFILLRIFCLVGWNAPIGNYEGRVWGFSIGIYHSETRNFGKHSAGNFIVDFILLRIFCLVGGSDPTGNYEGHIWGFSKGIYQSETLHFGEPLPKEFHCRLSRSACLDTTPERKTVQRQSRLTRGRKRRGALPDMPPPEVQSKKTRFLHSLYLLRNSISAFFRGMETIFLCPKKCAHNVSYTKDRASGDI